MRKLVVASLWIVVAAILATGCQPDDDGATSTHAIWSADATIETLHANPGHQLTDTGNGVRLASKFTKKPYSSGKTSASYFELTRKAERAISGRHILISVLASAPHALPRQKLALAFSTAAVGNSGWHELRVQKKLADYQFEYTVPEDPDIGSKTYSDYIGIISDVSGSGAPITIHSASISIIE